MEIQNDEWFENLIDDVESIIVEKEFESRFSLVEGYHILGTRILQDVDKFRGGVEEAVQRIAQHAKKSRRTIFYAIKFAKTFPDLNLLPLGKNVSWSKVVRRYLTDNATAEELPALPENLQEAILKNMEFILENVKQNKKGINLFLPYDRFL